MQIIADVSKISRTLVNNLLSFDSAWCLVIAQIQFSLIKNIKIVTSRTLAKLSRPYVLQHLIFPLLLHPSFKLDVICVLSLTTLAASDLFHMFIPFRMLIKSADVWTKSFIKQTESESLLFSPTFTSKLELVFVLAQENALS